MAKILVVDDEVGIRELLSEILYDEGHSVELAENATQARMARQQERPDLVLLDIWMPDTDGVTLLREWTTQGLLDMPVIMMSGHATIDTAVEATRIGAVDFLEKPITLQKLINTVQSVLEKNKHFKKSPSNGFAVQNGQDGKVQPFQSTPTARQANDSTEDASRNEALLSLVLDQPLREARDEFERIYFEFHLAQEGGSMTRVAEKTGLERTHLYRKLKQLGIELTKRKGL